MRTSTLPLLLMAFLLSGCARQPIDPFQCGRPDAYAVGYQAAYLGLSIAEVDARFAQCTPRPLLSPVAYQAGQQAGWAAYCTPARAQDLGARGLNYAINQCPTDQHTALLAAWQAGVHTYCTPPVLFSLGKKGEKKPLVCHADFREAVAAYARGAACFQASAELSQQLEAQQKELATRTAEIQAAQIDWQKQARANQRRPFDPANTYETRLTALKITSLTESLAAIKAQEAAIEKKQAEIQQACQA